MSSKPQPMNFKMFLSRWQEEGCGVIGSMGTWKWEVETGGGIGVGIF